MIDANASAGWSCSTKKCEIPACWRLAKSRFQSIVPAPTSAILFSMGPPENKMADVGAGTIDWKRLFARRQQAGISHFFVEHDQPADAFASIMASCDYLKRLEF